MTTTGSAKRFGRLLVDGPGLVAIALLAAAVTLWGVPARGLAALDAAPFGLGLGYFGIVAGRLVIGALRLPAGRWDDIPVVLLVGIMALNVALLVAALLSPLSLAADALLIATGIIGWAVLGGSPPRRATPAAGGGLTCLAISLVAATLWSLDSISPMDSSRGVVTFRPWSDSYTHACFVRIFRDVHGIGSLEHFSLAGVRAPAYHYAGFLLPGLLARTSGASCYLAFATFMVPFGMALTGLAAYTLARSWWSPGAGLAATVGVLLLPDASHYAIANPLLGYHWLAETGPTLLYGIAMVAVAWALVFEGCRAGRPAIVAAGFAAAGLSVAFKAHLFVANALLIWIWPAFGLRGCSRRGRLIWFVFAALSFATAVRVSSGMAGVPLLKLDGSGFRPYLQGVTANLNDPTLRRLLAIGPTTPRAEALGIGVVHLAVGTLGAFALVLPVLAVVLVAGGRGDDRRDRIEAASFPILVTANYLVMALGLAVDDRTHHMPEELLHRPLVWAYFAVAAWSLGCFFELAIRPRLGRRGPMRVLIPAVLVGLLVVPYLFGRGVQVGPGWGKDYSNLRVPIGLVRCAEFLRDHADRGDVVQNSAEDRWIMLGALAERPVYVADTWRTPAQTNEEILRRLAELERFRRMTDPDEIAGFAHRCRIAWFVLDPATPVRWPASILDRPAFEAGGFRVYRFPPSA